MFDVRPVLARIAQYAPDRIPADRAGTVDAWSEHFSEYPHLTTEDALMAVTKFFKQTAIRPGVILPSDISQIAREIRQDSALRGDGRDQEAVRNRERERVSDAVSIELDWHKDEETGFEKERFRFCWDGPVHQPFGGQWRDIKAAAIADGINWCEQQSVRPDEDVTRKPLYGIEHPPGDPCAAPGCPKPSTFLQWCARHYCISKGKSLGLPIG